MTPSGPQECVGCVFPRDSVPEHYRRAQRGNRQTEGQNKQRGGENILHVVRGVTK